MFKKLDINEKQEVKYCVPLFIRDEQIKRNIANVKGRIEPYYEKRNDPIALVAFGPSLNQTWEKLKDFKYIMSCSGSHKFLIEKGIIPTWHNEVDPRPHKIELLGAPHPDVIYLPASTCHPDYFAWLGKHNAQIKMWHVFDSYEEGLRVLPHGEWALVGGASVGLRMFTIARFLGFVDFHIFGMDGCFGESGSHSAFHPNAPKDKYTVDYEGKTYHTSPSILEVAKQTLRELDQLKDVTYKFYGEGLVQEMAKNYKKILPEVELAIGISKPELISAEYRALNAQLHKENIVYGIGGVDGGKKRSEVVLKLYESVGAKSLLDYGAGKQQLTKNLPMPIWSYDPAFPEISESPRPADLVVCLDVLEHVEPDKLDFVLSDIARCILKCGYFIIYTQPAQKILPDGRNTHLIQEGKEWWEDKLSKYFELFPNSIIERGPELHVIAGPKKTKIKYNKVKAA